MEDTTTALTSKTVMQSVDRRAPKPPSSLSVSAVSTTSISTWGASRDNVGVTGYGVYLNGTRPRARPRGRTPFSPRRVARHTKSASTRSMQPGTGRACVRPGGNGTVPRRDAADRAREPAPARLEPDRARGRVDRVVRQRRRGRLQHLPRRRPDRGSRNSTQLDGGPRLRRATIQSRSRRTTQPATVLPGQARSDDHRLCRHYPTNAPRTRVSGSTYRPLSLMWEAADDRGVAEYRLVVNDVDITDDDGNRLDVHRARCGRSYVVKAVVADAPATSRRVRA